MQKKEEIIKAFNPNDLGVSGSIFGLPFNLQTADLVLIPIPWEVTVSYAAGTADGPAHILEASTQVDLYQKDLVDAWKMGIHLLAEDKQLRLLSDANREKAVGYIDHLEAGTNNSKEAKKLLEEVNGACGQMVQTVKEVCQRQLKKGKLVGLVGGDHSTPLGYLQALAEEHESFGVLQIDAHHDLRASYEDFEYSHASIMYNALKLDQIEKLVQVGIRDFCEEEALYVQNNTDRVEVFYDEDYRIALFEGENWKTMCERMIDGLPQKVYISFDIDGLQPDLCPNTGTPVPGGLSFQEVNYLITKLARSGRQIIGFDLNEVAPAEDHDWNGNVGARVLYRLANLIGVTNEKIDWAVEAY